MNHLAGTFVRAAKSSRFAFRANRGSLLCLSLGMYNMVSARCHLTTSALVADVSQSGDSGRLFRGPSLAGTCSPYSSAASRSASRTSAKASLRQQASQVCALIRIRSAKSARYGRKYWWFSSCLCYCEQWTDQSSIELIVSSTNLVTMSNMNSSNHTSKMNGELFGSFSRCYTSRGV